MKVNWVCALCAFLMAISYGPTNAGAQAAADSVEAHVALAKQAAGNDYSRMFENLCAEPRAPAAQPAAPAASPAPPPASEWHAEPAKVFDNLYYVGSKPVAAWAVTTSEGIILIDALYEYSVEDEIVNGLRKLGLDPTKIKYVIVTHGHADHYAGAPYLQSRLGARILMSAADWEFMKSQRNPNWPQRDMVVTDGQKLTLGDTTLTLYLTPGHTPGTISLLVPLKDGGKEHLAAMWGGTAFNFPRTQENFRTYSNSAQRFSDIVEKARVDVVLTNHPDNSKVMEKIAALQTRPPGGSHPFVVGNESQKRLLQVAGECAKANLSRLTTQAKQ
ncbi:MAG TPA: MBL fold metallo-hydrolase [Candidatus Binatia bacterium]